MEDFKKLRIYNNLAGGINVVNKVLSATSLSELGRLEAIYQWVSNQKFTIVGLHTKPPRYASGREVYQEFYSETTPDNDYVGLAVRENFKDIVEPRLVNVQIQNVDNNNNQLIFGGDWTSEMSTGETHTILSGQTYQFVSQVETLDVLYISGSDITVVTYLPNTLTNISIGDICNFQGGQKLVGVEHEIEWFDISGNPVITKSFYSRFESFEAGLIEYKRRQNTINQLISAADASSVQPYIKTIYEYYKTPYINDYINVGDYQSWKNAIDNEQDPKIISILDIIIPFTNIEDETVMKKIRDYIKDELYVGYR